MSKPTWSLCSVKVCAHVRVCRSHSFTLASLEPVAKAFPFGWHATLSTHDSWPAAVHALRTANVPPLKLLNIPVRDFTSPQQSRGPSS